MVTLTTASNALKDVYLGVISNQLNTSINPLLTRLKQTTKDVWGKEIRKVAPFGLNGGVGAGTENGSLPASGENMYQQFVLTLKNLYGRIEITDKAVRASENSAGAFVNLLTSEMEGLLKASAFNFGRMLYGDGTGVLATVSDNDTDSVTLSTTKNLYEGMTVDVVNQSYVPIKEILRIKNIDRTNNIVTFTNAPMTKNAYQGLNYYVTVQGSKQNELTGLGAIFKSTGTLYGIDRSTNSWLVPYMQDITVSSATQDITDTIIQTAIDDLDENADSKVDFIVCSAGVKRNYQSYLASYRSNINILELEGGYKAISYNGIPLVSDKFADNNSMYLLNTSEFNLHQLCDWKWLETEEGKVIRQIPNKPIYQATLVKYADIICNKPRGQALITGITES